MLSHQKTTPDGLESEELANGQGGEDGGSTFFANQIWLGLQGDAEFLQQLRFRGAGALPSMFAVSDLASAAIACAALAVSELVTNALAERPAVWVDRRLASFWYAYSIRPSGWILPPAWDAVAGDYQTSDGWIRLHTNAPHHRQAALAVLDAAANRDAVAKAVLRWKGVQLENAIVENHGCAAMMRSIQDWQAHPQGVAVSAEALVQRQLAADSVKPQWQLKPDRPLHGIKVLDLTRVLAGPVATRFLAAYGADVLRIDAPDWDEPSLVPEVTLGKRCARLNLKNPDQRQILETLLQQADVLVHGYRSDALAKLGLDAERRRELNPGLVDVCLDAYGWTGAWKERRGFDSLVQMSTGIAEAGMRGFAKDRPTPLPVQALDHAAGYILAAAAIRGLTQRLQTTQGSTAKTSLARVAELLIRGSACIAPSHAGSFVAESAADQSPDIEHTSWGTAQRLLPPVLVHGAPMRWDLPASALGSAIAKW